MEPCFWKALGLPSEPPNWPNKPQTSYGSSASCAKNCSTEYRRYQRSVLIGAFGRTSGSPGGRLLRQRAAAGEQAGASQRGRGRDLLDASAVALPNGGADLGHENSCGWIAGARRACFGAE
jgi:hypothetical protein